MAAEPRLLGQLRDPLTPDYHLELLQAGDRLVIRTHRTSTGSSGERSWPLAAVAWLHDTIVNGFWKPPAEGGLPRDTRAVEAEFAGERLELRRGWGIGGPGEPGFTVTNMSRTSALGLPEELPLSDELLIRGGLLALLATIGSPR